VRVCFWMSDKPRERILAAAFLDGVRAIGDTGFERSLAPDIQVADCDVAVMVGVKSRDLFRAHWASGAHIVYLDKGYTRHAADSPVKLWEYWRCAVDAHQPDLSIERPADRLGRLALTLREFGGYGEEVLIAGSSAKYHEFYGLHEPTKYAKKLVRNLRQFTDRPIAYRPKPSWREAVPIGGTRFSRPPETVEGALERAHCLVTHGSNACFEAICLGVPVICTGPAAAMPISDRELSRVNTPHVPSPAERLEWLARLAYCQFTMSEFASGAAWSILRPQIFSKAGVSHAT
jgi:hypothetical protein